MSPQCPTDRETQGLWFYSGKQHQIFPNLEAPLFRDFLLNQNTRACFLSRGHGFITLNCQIPEN